MTTVKAPATSVLITGKSGFNALLTYEFEVRARCDGWKGEWIKVVENRGMSTYVAVPGRNRTVISLHNLTELPRSKRCDAKLPLRAGLICAAKMHEYLISLHSTYEPHP